MKLEQREKKEREDTEMQDKSSGICIRLWEYRISVHQRKVWWIILTDHLSVNYPRDWRSIGQQSLPATRRTFSRVKLDGVAKSVTKARALFLVTQLLSRQRTGSSYPVQRTFISFVHPWYRYSVRAPEIHRNSVDNLSNANDFYDFYNTQANRLE